MRRCSRCSPCPSRDLAALRAATWLASIALVAAGAGLAPAPAAAATVSGTVTVERATPRTAGPKHDRDVVLYLASRDGAEHPPSDAAVTMDQRGLVFLPHVLPVQRGTTVTFLNNDNDQHNVYFLFDETGETLDIGTWGPGVSVDHRFEEPGEVIVLCKLHLEMAAYILVVDGPWFTRARLDDAGAKAAFALEGVPPGAYELRAWHKKLKQKGGAARITVPEDGAQGVEVVITQAKYAAGRD
jgi:plastocyanin